MLPPPSRSDASEGEEGTEVAVSSLDRASSASRLVGRATYAVSKPVALLDATGQYHCCVGIISPHLSVGAAQDPGL